MSQIHMHMHWPAHQVHVTLLYILRLSTCQNVQKFNRTFYTSMPHELGSLIKFFLKCQVVKTITPHRLGRRRSKERAKAQLNVISQQPTVTKKKECQTKYGLKDGHNPLFDLSIDIYQ